ncbi:MAG: YggS family pyridoxal phosphate-dependent enzyme [Bacteroidetes bacterium]|nr:YggS family pyridoxal phosphate-dependent enzyme [Bacteroidota bacterium]
MSIAENIHKIKSKIPENVTLVAVTKTKPVELIKEAYKAGHKIFGENKVQEMMDKKDLLPGDIQWHLIGHLQSNKVKFIAPFVSLIHSIDSLKLLKEVDKQAEKNKRIIKVLLQVHIAKEETKFGFSMEEIAELVQSEEFKSLKHIKVAGLMGMATFTENEAIVRSEFSSLKALFEQIKALMPEGFKEVSMGMSGDYKIAIEEGSTMVRVGSALFGSR